MADVTDQTPSMFRTSTLGRITNADDLDHYIKVTTPNGWLVVACALSLVFGIAFWSATATVPTTKTFTGILTERNLVLWVDEDTHDNIREGGGAVASVANVRSESVLANDMPLSRSEIMGYFGNDYILDNSEIFDWNYIVNATLEGDVPNPYKSDESAEEGQSRVVPVEITTSEIHPIDLVFGKR